MYICGERTESKPFDLCKENTGPFRTTTDPIDRRTFSVTDTRLESRSSLVSKGSKN